MFDEYLEENIKTWNLIAKSFDVTRNKPWNHVMEFIESLSKTDIVADLGCGNGRHLIPCSKYCKNIIGVDVSIELINIIKNKINMEKIQNCILINSSVTNIPIKNNTLDAVLYIASLHNIKGRENRLKSLIEINRILKNNGRALISVWSRWQDKYYKQFIKKLFFQMKNEEFGDIDIYWKKNNLNIPRFYHLYSKREFIADLKKACLKIVDIKEEKITSKKFSDNFFVTVKA